MNNGEIIEKLKEGRSITLDSEDYKSELELAKEECIRLNKLCMKFIDEKCVLRNKLDKKEKDLEETTQLMQEVQEANKKVQEINEKLCKSLKAANRDFFIAAALLFICTVALAFNI